MSDRKVRRKRLTPTILAQAIRIAAKTAEGEPNPNPLYIEALEVAAAHFDALAAAKKRSSSDVPQCSKCEKPAALSSRKGTGGFSQYCIDHLIAQREYQRQRAGRRRRNLGASSYRASQ